MQSLISFVLDRKIVSLDFQDPSGPQPTTTVLNYLRSFPAHKGVKEGCAEGDCGACTVVLGELGPNDTIRYRSVDSCLVFLPMIHGKQLITVEDLKDNQGKLHPVQQDMVLGNGSQCGYCTPGIIMSIFSLFKTKDHPTREEIDDALTGNLCRCTGYKPIVEGAATSCVNHTRDHFTSQEPHIAGILKSISSQTIHIKTHKQEYFRPATLQEALSLKRSHPDASVICGATDVALRVTKLHELLREIIDISAITDLRRINDSAASLALGAGVTLSDAVPSMQKEFPAFYEMLTVFGSQQIRNLASIGGNLGTASPIGDAIPVLIAYNANVVLENDKGRREVPIDEFIAGYRQTTRKPEELITSVVLPKPSNGARVKFYKVSKRKDLDISTISGGFRLEVDNSGIVEKIKLAFGGMADHTKRATTAERFFIGKPWNRSVVHEGMALIDQDFVPISDARGSKEFRTVAARNLVLKFWSETNGQNSQSS